MYDDHGQGSILSRLTLYLHDAFVKHLPTGLNAESHSARSQHRNYEQAFRLLRGKLWVHRRLAS